MKYQTVRELVYETALKAKSEGLIYLSAGNFSAPGSLKYEDMRPEDIVIVDVNAQPVDVPRKPSSETPMHTTIYRLMPEIQGICHTHSSYAITFASLGQPVPAINLELLVCGAPIPVAPWACPGTGLAGELIADLMRQRPELRVVLLRNHGLVCATNSLNKALDLAFDAEMGMKAYHQALQIGTPNVLSDAQRAEIFEVYGAF
jgi:ribulose-5-phosphate 4-epimerase/fuculose-1-phosphate aldolase